jgi:hypothetical protein
MAGEELDYRIGPTSAASARAWVAVARANIASIVAAGARAPFRMPPEVVARFHEVLDAWEAAAAAEPFIYVGSEERDRARVLLTYWLNIISLTAAQREALGVVEWPAESVPFEEAVGRAILGGLRDDAQLRRINRALRGRRRR